MGAETSVVGALFFLVFLVVSVTTYSSFDYYKNLVKNAQVDQDTMKKTKLQTDITITNVSFRNDSGNFYLDIALLNTGKTTLNASLLEIFIDGVYYPSYTLSTGNTWVPKNSTTISFYPTAAAGAIKIDNTGTSTFQGFGTALNLPFTVGSGANRFLIVGLSYLSNPGTTNVTYNNTGLTKAMTANNGSNYYAELWYLKDPPSGSYSINSTRGGTFPAAVLGAWSYTGVDSIGNITNNTGALSPSNVDITTTVANSVLVDVETNNQAASLTVGAGQTQRYQNNSAVRGGGSEMNASTIRTYNMNWTIGSSPGWTNIAAELKPYMSNTAPPTVSRIKVVTENGISDYFLR